MKLNQKVLFMVTIVTMISILGCVKEPSKIALPTLPILVTMSASDITGNAASSGGYVVSPGSSPVALRGVCWDVNQNPSILNNKTMDGEGSGSFFSLITGLSPGTIYYVRAYAVNSYGISYGNQQILITQGINLNNGLLSWYPFDGNAEDKSGNGNHASRIGTSLTSDRNGKINSAYRFEGNNDVIYVPNTTLAPQDFTISLWFKILSHWNYTTLNLFSISKNNNNEEGGVVVRLDQNSSAYGYGNYKFYVAINKADNPSNSVVSKNFILGELNFWNHLVVTKKGSEIRLFINNSCINMATIPDIINYSNVYMQIGNKRNLNGNILGGREIDEVRIYNRILNSLEIEYLFSH